MKIITLAASIAFAGLLSTGAFAATTSRVKTTTAAPAAAATAKKKTSTMSPEKQAVSKQCSSLADAKGLHGKDREKFRAECKKNGGKAPQT
ncbi:MAG: PsiF family protein [Mesorhizobium sp.]